MTFLPFIFKIFSTRRTHDSEGRCGSANKFLYWAPFFPPVRKFGPPFIPRAPDFLSHFCIIFKLMVAACVLRMIWKDIIEMKGVPCAPCPHAVWTVNSLVAGGDLVLCDVIACLTLPVSRFLIIYSAEFRCLNAKMCFWLGWVCFWNDVLVYATFFYEARFAGDSLLIMIVYRFVSCYAFSRYMCIR